MNTVLQHHHKQSTIHFIKQDDERAKVIERGGAETTYNGIRIIVGAGVQAMLMITIVDGGGMINGGDGRRTRINGVEIMERSDGVKEGIGCS